MNTHAAKAERRKLPRTRSLVLALSVILAAAWQVACGGSTGGIDPPPAPVASIAPGSLAFGNQTINTTSTAQTVTLTNTGNAALNITSLALTGTNASDFAQTNTCGSSVAAGSNCTISVTFTPAASGSRTASVSITDNASGSPQAVSLSGTGTATVVSLSATSLAFANQSVGTTSTAQTLTLSNTGNAALSITSVALTGTNASDFAQSNTCGSSLAAGANCTIVVMFTPSVAGTEAASLSIADNCSGSPQTVSLSGAGTHDVILSWTASTTAGVVGYNVYRGTTSGGPYPTELNSAPINGTTYTDETVQAGQTYYYVVTAVASNDVTQSADSNQVSAPVPSP
ncbi:MAG: choice-of-anchor D domain-containing protein [Terriglobia bacterium]